MDRYPEAYLRYLRHFHDTRDYFECHEELEEYWKEHPDSPHRLTWVGLIQVAVSAYHHRRGNMRGALKMMESAVRQLDADSLSALGIDAARFLALLHERVAQLKRRPEAPYRELDIPVADPALEPYVRREPHREPDASIVHKHLRRDRSDVVAAREAALSRRKGLR